MNDIRCIGCRKNWVNKKKKTQSLGLDIDWLKRKLEKKIETDAKDTISETEEKYCHNLKLIWKKK